MVRMGVSVVVEFGRSADTSQPLEMEHPGPASGSGPVPIRSGHETSDVLSPCLAVCLAQVLFAAGGSLCFRRRRAHGGGSSVLAFRGLHELPCRGGPDFAVLGERRLDEEQRGLGLVLIDGSPGIGCPVIASITGADLVLIVTEPTLSGLHDLGRVADVARHFGIAGMVCVNKWDLNPELAGEIERQAQDHGLAVAGRVRYDRAVTEAQIRKQTIVEYQSNGCAEDIRNVWSCVEHNLIAAGNRNR